MPLEELDVLRVRKGFVLATRVVTYLIYVYVVVVEIILILGFFLLLFGANPSAGFTQWAYRNLDRVMEPFRGIFTPIQLGTTSGNVEAVFETSVLFAMIVYLILGLLLSALTRWLSQRLRYLDAAEADAAARTTGAGCRRPAGVADDTGRDTHGAQSAPSADVERSDRLTGSAPSQADTFGGPGRDRTCDRGIMSPLL